MSEYLHVEKPFLDQLAALGWTVIDQGHGVTPSDPSASLHGSFREWLLPEVFRNAVRAINRTADGKEWLKARKLIEGRRPNVFISSTIAAVTGAKAAYIKNLAFDKGHYKDMVLAYLRKFDEATRPDLDGLLLEKVSDALNGNQKKRFVTNLLQEMRREGLIFPDGTTRWAKWRMSKPKTKGDGSG